MVYLSFPSPLGGCVTICNSGNYMSPPVARFRRNMLLLSSMIHNNVCITRRHRSSPSKTKGIYRWKKNKIKIRKIFNEYGLNFPWTGFYKLHLTNKQTLWRSVLYSVSAFTPSIHAFLAYTLNPKKIQARSEPLDPI